MAVTTPKEIDDFTIPSDITMNTTIGGYSNTTYGAIPTLSAGALTLGNIAFNHSTNNAYTYTVPTSSTGANAVWTTSGTGWSPSAAGATVAAGGKIALQGDGADIDINGKSMKAWMEQVEQRLNLLIANPKLEKEWDELRELGERYRNLEKLCKEKSEAWQKLKSMPPVSNNNF